MKWEYKTVKINVASFWEDGINAEETDNSINELGQQGWELVTGLDLNHGHGSSTEVVLIFKRPMAD